LTLIPSLFLAANAVAQKSPTVPLISGGIGFLSSTNRGSTTLQPVLAPVLAFPLGDHLLVESRADLREFFVQTNNTGPYNGTFFPSLQYLQLDYIANPHLTVVAGRFLTPFGTYNERLTPIWISNFQDAPLIYPIGTRTSGSSDGGVVRGSVYASSDVNLSYIGYFSARSGPGQFEAGRAAGGRFDLYLPRQRLEIGTSYQRFLQNTHNNSIGAHVWWMPWSSPLQIRSEYAHGAHAQGYWVEAAYPLSQLGGADSLLGRLEPVFRMQQTFRNSPGPGDGLPAVDTQQADFGFDYHFPHEVRLNTSYSRSFSSTNGNIWQISLTYRLLFPTWRGSR
jgi:hypothetical protein